MNLLHGDCREVMASLDACSIDAIVTDPPYGLEFMGKDWDRLQGYTADTGFKGFTLPRQRQRNVKCPDCNLYIYADARRRCECGGVRRLQVRSVQVWHEAWAREAFRVLKPGGHMVAFSAPRTYHRMACAIEDAGFEIRDSLMWLFGSGFPKSLNLHGEWEGWGTALKPAYEPIVLARKPLTGTVAGNVERWGTGGLNIDATRIGTDAGWSYPNGAGGNTFHGQERRTDPEVSRGGRWPANVLLDAEAARLLDAMSGETGASSIETAAEYGQHNEVLGAFAGHAPFAYADRGGASRFFYTAKSSRREREFGLDDLEPTRRSDGRDKDIENPRLRTNERRNDHPTVKPVDLMRWLCRLVTPPNGLVLDPFMGSGSTGMAALDEGFQFVGIDMDEHYIEIARRRIARRHVLEPLPQRESGQGVLL
jgi:site-specific DNA-methyltransferase (adenine-specific)